MTHHDTDQGPDRHRHGADPAMGLMMMLCCVPMLVIGIILLASGNALGFLVLAAMCALMMAGMMGGMSSGNGDGGAGG